ncbi:MAG: HK97 family phage prohead protease [Anaerolineaceae bacterium]|nr:HK97 family phage prohead protease [Anaerolineaceae bacterium]
MTIFKQFPSKIKAIDEERGIFEAMITTQGPDRGGDIVRAGGAVLDNFRKNPVVLFAHDYSSPPVAKAISITVLPGQGIKSQYQFPQRGISPRADEIRDLIAAGFMNGVSIGFVPLVSADIKSSGDSWNPPQDYQSWELLEYSICPVPANADALTQAMKALTKSERTLSAENVAKIQGAVDALRAVLIDVENGGGKYDNSYRNTRSGNNWLDNLHNLTLRAIREERNPANQERIALAYLKVLEALVNPSRQATVNKYQERLFGQGAVDFYYSEFYF